MTEPKLRDLAFVRDFRRARRRADLQQIMAQLTGGSTDLLCYGDIYDRLKAEGSVDRGLQDIPLEAIIGSVGRCDDFTRAFMPLKDSAQQRWTNIRSVTDLTRLPPIEVYRIGQAYFVLDGNHRVSVARQLGVSYIQARVLDVCAKVSLSPQDRPDDIIAKAEYASFLEHTGLDELRPEMTLLVTTPGQYRVIEAQIEAHRRNKSQGLGRDVLYEQAVVDWYDEVYFPAVRVIRDVEILQDFPDRTETDLYLWLLQHRAALEAELGWSVSPETVAADFASRSSSLLRPAGARLWKRLQGLVAPAKLQSGPGPGSWRRERPLLLKNGRLFSDILVAIDGQDGGWSALDQAIEISRREGSRLYGLHVVPTEDQRYSRRSLDIGAEFQRRCQEAGVRGQLAIEVGRVAPRIVERARWVDLIVLGLDGSPRPRPRGPHASGWASLLRRSSRPIWTVPGRPVPLERVLLAYDGSPQADEALFVAKHLTGRWEVPLLVLTVAENGQAGEAQRRAQSQLVDHAAPVRFIQQEGPVASTILQTARAHDSGLIIVGGSKRKPSLGKLLDRSLKDLLRANRQALLICR